MPLSLVRYPLSLGLKSPVLLALIGCIFLIANQELAAEDTIEQVRRSEPSEATNSAQHAAKPMPWGTRHTVWRWTARPVSVQGLQAVALQCIPVVDVVAANVAIQGIASGGE